MERALDLAERGRYSVSPNPMVGAVVVRGGRVVGEGFHRRAGGPHAEIEALSQAGARAAGRDPLRDPRAVRALGRTPPCTDAIEPAGFARVVSAARDPNPLVAGRGFSAPAPRGDRDGLAGRRRNGGARNRRTRNSEPGSPAGAPSCSPSGPATLDGKIASAAGESRWITGRMPAGGPAASRGIRRDPRRSRDRAGRRSPPDPASGLECGHAASADRPRRPPPRSGAGAPLPRPRGVIVVTAQPDRTRARGGWRAGSRRLEPAGPQRREGRYPVLLRRLARDRDRERHRGRRFRHAVGVLPRGCVDAVAVFLSPSILGGATAPGGVGGTGFGLARSPILRDLAWERVGEDALLTAKVS